MRQPSSDEDKQKHLRDKIIGLGENSIRKSYYPELQHRLAELERFRTLLDQSTNVIFLVRVSDALIADVTLAATLQLGYTRDELVNTPVFSLLDAASAQQFERYVDTPKLVRPARFVGISQVRKVDGMILPMEVVVSPVEMDGVEYVVAVGQEISERIRAERKNQDQLRHLNALHQIDLAITSPRDLTGTLQMVLQHITASLGVDAAAILSAPPDDQPRYLAWYGFRKTSLAQIIPQHMQEGCFARRALSELILIPDLSATDQGLCDSRVLLNEEFVTSVSLPLMARDMVKGVLEIYHREPLNPDAEWLNYLNSYAAQAAIAMDNGQMLLDLHQTYDQLNLAYDATLEGWALALELRERETAQHTKRVQTLTLRLAREFGITGDALVQVRRGSLLHDIGKMGIPDHILLKPGPLNDDEWKIMRLHPEYAYNMLSPVDFLRPALEIPYCHHEKWDGSGYPRRLKGDEIPLAARLFAVVDVWDALLSDRPYRTAWSRERVVDYMRGESGRHFDPRVLQLFLEKIVG